MKVFRNLFGDNSKIHVDEIAYKDLEGIARLLGWGVIVEEGSNSDGKYVKWGNGWQVCTANVVVDFSNNDIQSFPYPSEFIDVFHVSKGYITASSSQTVLPILNSTLIRQLENGWAVYKYGDTYNDTRRLSLFAIGRWK